MKKQVFGRKFKRTRNQRKALFSGLVSAMILKGKITTTEEKAKAIRPDLEKLVTKAKQGENSKMFLQPYLKSFEIDKMINEIAPTFKNVNGGYTRIIKMGRRLSDNASMALMQWTKDIQIKNPALPAGREKLNIKNKKSKRSKKVKKSVRKQSKEESRKAVRKTNKKESK